MLESTIYNEGMWNKCISPKGEQLNIWQNYCKRGYHKKQLVSDFNILLSTLNRSNRPT